MQLASMYIDGPKEKGVLSEGHRMEVRPSAVADKVMPHKPFPAVPRMRPSF